MRQLISAFALLALLTACNKDDPKPFAFESQVKLLAGKPNASKTWLLESLMVNGSPIDIPACDEDNHFTFYNNGLQQYTITAGGQTCSPASPQLLEEGAWMMAIDGKTMTISGSKIYVLTQMNFFGLISSKPGTILELTEDTFRIEIKAIDGVGSQTVNTVISMKAL